MTPPEQRHIAGAFAFELAKCQENKIRLRMLGHLGVVDEQLQAMVAEKLGLEEKPEKMKPALPPNRNVKPSRALSQYADAPASIAGRKIGVLVTDGVDGAVVDALAKKAKSDKAKVEIVAPKVGGVLAKGGTRIAADHSLEGAPSAVFDAVVLAPSKDGAKELTKLACAVDWLRMAFAHLKAIGYTADALPIFESAGVEPDADDGVVAVTGTRVTDFLEAAKKHRIWDREVKVRS
jgi:catalase